MNLITRPTFDISRKVQASTLAAIFTTVVISGLNAYVPGLGDALGPTLAGGIISVAAFIGGYLVREKA